MPNEEVRRRLADDVQLWLADGLITPESASVLAARWQARELGVAGVVRYLGVMGASLACLGLLGFVAAASGSEGVALAVVGCVAALFLWLGIAMARDGTGRYATSSRAVIALGTAAFAGATMLGGGILGVFDDAVTFVAYGGLVWVPTLLALAYLFRIRFTLTLALFGAMHCVGSWASMAGRSSYVVHIDSPPGMALFAAIVVAVGIWHSRVLSDRYPGFHVPYEVVGLLYLDLSLLILSIDESRGSHFYLGSRLAWTLVLTVVSFAQILLGARLQDGRLLGFGVTFLAIDLFTRYYETFWSSMHRGAFFVLGGGALFTAGAGIEWWMSRRRRTS